MRRQSIGVVAGSCAAGRQASERECPPSQRFGARSVFCLSLLLVIYGAYDLGGAGDRIDKDAPPLFAMVAHDDPLKLAPSCVVLYQAWAAPGKRAGLHVYTKGGHGFGINKRGLPIDARADRYVEWLTQLNVIKK
jgi:hypothetical protein